MVEHRRDLLVVLLTLNVWGQEITSSSLTHFHTHAATLEAQMACGCALMMRVAVRLDSGSGILGMFGHWSLVQNCRLEKIEHRRERERRKKERCELRNGREINVKRNGWS